MELLHRLAPHPAFLQLCIHVCMKHLVVFILTTALLSHTVAFNDNTLIYQGENRYIINTVLSELSIIMSHQTVFLKKAQKNKDVLFAPN